MDFKVIQSHHDDQVEAKMNEYANLGYEIYKYEIINYNGVCIHVVMVKK